jgi:hypothetical protein
MGGYGATRWGTTVTRVLADEQLRLDVRALARAGALHPCVTWGSRARIDIWVRRERPDRLQVEYWVHELRVPGRPIREAIPLVTSACYFGGSCVWFACPGCACRRAVLYCLAGWFRCRVCHQLAYGSTRRNVNRRVLP